MNNPLEHYLYLRGRLAFEGAPILDAPLTLAEIIVGAGGEPPWRTPTGDDAYCAVQRAYEAMIREPEMNGAT